MVLRKQILKYQIAETQRRVYNRMGFKWELEGFLKNRPEDDRLKVFILSKEGSL